MTPEEAYEEALRRIREAEETGVFDLIGLETLTRLPPELKRLTSLQSLNLFECDQLSGDLAPLPGSNFATRALPARLPLLSPVCPAQILAPYCTA
jgi:hypothetical protein